MERQFTRQAENALKLAKTTAKTCGHGYIGTEHLLAGLLKEPEGTAGKVLQEFNVEEEKLRELISSLVTPVQGNTAVAETKDPQYSPRARRIIEQAEEDAESMECLCGTEHLLLSLLKETDCVATRLLFTMGVNIQKLFAAILTAMGFDNDTIAEEFQYARNAGNKKVTSTPTLDQYSRDLTQLAAEGKLDPVIGRDKEVTRLIQILSRRTKNNPCLTGEPGVGKTAIVEGLAQRIVMGMVPDTVKDKRLVVLDLSGMVAGSKYRGEFEERIKNVIQEVKEHQGILLFIDEIHTIIGAGGAPASWVREQIQAAKKETDKPFGVNLMLMNPEADEIAKVIVEEGVKVVTTGAGNPAKYMSMWKEAKIKVIPVVASVALAKLMERGGADALVAEGMESGGHIGAQTTMTLVPQVVDAVSIPVIAAGGIADGRGFAAAMMLGAEAVQMGTRFVVAKESTVHENYKQRVVKAKDIDSEVTGMSTGHPIRVIRNKMTREYLKKEKEGAPFEELEQMTLGALRKAVVEGDVMYGSVMAGQSAALVKKEETCAEIIRDVMSGAEKLLGQK